MKSDQSPFGKRLRVLGIIVLSIVLAAPTGCAVLIPAAIAGAGTGAALTSDIRVKPGAAVQVGFQPARDVGLIARNGRDTTLLAGARLLVGRVRELRGDSLWVTISEAHATDGKLHFDRNSAPEALVRFQEGVRIEPLANQAAYIVTGGILGTGAAIALIFLMCYLDPCFN